MNSQPPRPQPAFGHPANQPAVPEDHPEQTHVVPDYIPEPPDAVPDVSPDPIREPIENIEEEASGAMSSIPDGWISRGETEERLSRAGIVLDGRQIRHLCARNELISVKVLNERNQPQYFIDPASVDAFVAKKLKRQSSGQDPEPSGANPVSDPQPSTVNVAKSEEDASGHKPEGQGGDQDAKDVQIASLTAQLAQAEKTVDHLWGELEHRRTTDKALAEVIEAFRLNAETQAASLRLSQPNSQTPPQHPESGGV